MTTFTPEAGAVEIVARPELDKERYPTEKLPGDLLTPNLCWQLHRAPGFASKPEPYPEFVKRCFIFTERGMTFLDQTTRRKIPVRSLADRYNNPVWVQVYVGDWQPVPFASTNSWADYSPDRYTTTLIGTVSRDSNYLAALGSDSAPTMCQAWHDCMHNNPQWAPTDSPPAERIGLDERTVEARSVDGARRREDELPHAVRPSSLEQAARPLDIHSLVERRRGDRRPHAGPGRKVH